MISGDIGRQIAEELKRIEQDENVKILYACESGSRAWGFPSTDSDYDVRFIYIRSQADYLSVFDKRDVIERPISNDLDINGWDLKKALKLMSKSNPSLLEWLQSPIVYKEEPSITGNIRELSKSAFSPRACLYHYMHMAKGNFRMYLQGDQVKIKKYFYVLRPVLACEWMERFNKMPPMEFEVLVDTLLPESSPVRKEVRHLLDRKKSGEEMDEEPKIFAIHEYLEDRLAALERAASGFEASGQIGSEALDDLFRSALRESGSS